MTSITTIPVIPASVSRTINYFNVVTERDVGGGGGEDKRRPAEIKNHLILHLYFLIRKCQVVLIRLRYIILLKNSLTGYRNKLSLSFSQCSVSRVTRISPPCHRPLLSQYCHELLLTL